MHQKNFDNGNNKWNGMDDEIIINEFNFVTKNK